MMKISSDTRTPGDKSKEPRIAPALTTDFLMKQGLLPVTNYLPDVGTIKEYGVKMFIASGKTSLDKRRR